jgi:hypothetical protein
LNEMNLLEPREGDLPERRRSGRHRALKSATIVCKYYDVKCQILDFSDGGALLRPTDITQCPNQFSLKTSTGPSRTCKVVWRGQHDRRSLLRVKPCMRTKAALICCSSSPQRRIARHPSWMRGRTGRLLALGNPPTYPRSATYYNGRACPSNPGTNRKSFALRVCHFGLG